MITLLKISHRGRKRLRYWLFQAARSAVSHAEEFKELHVYYTTRADNPLKKMQSLIVIACKILRVIYTILKTGRDYDPQKMLKDIKRPKAALAANKLAEFGHVKTGDGFPVRNGQLICKRCFSQNY